MGLSTGQLTRMRAQVAALLPQSAKIRRVTRTSDGMGGWTESYSDTTVACRLDPVSEQAVAGVIADQQSVVVRYRLTVPHNADLRVEDKVQVDGRTYRVLQLDADHAWRVTRRAIVSEVR